MMTTFTQSESSEESSCDKLSAASCDLRQLLVDIISQKLPEQHGETGSLLNLSKIPEIEVLQAAHPSLIHSSHSSHEVIEGEAYRCKCAFQIVPRSSLASSNQKEAIIDNAEKKEDLICVVRERGTILPLPNGIFPPANFRIRRAMRDLMDCLNSQVTENGANSSEYKFSVLRQNLTSVTFVSSWVDHCSSCVNTRGNEVQDMGGDCLVTLHYGPPGLTSDSSGTSGDAFCHQSWKEKAKLICDHCHFNSITGRSKGVKISVTGVRSNNHDHVGSPQGSEVGISGEGWHEEEVIRDDLWLTLQHIQNDGYKSHKTHSLAVENVSLIPPDTVATDNDCNLQLLQKHVHIQYRKPASAFQHPNAGVMLTSLRWILNIISKISAEQTQGDNGLSTPSTQSMSPQKSLLPSQSLMATPKPRLLEMYCGCGAHTVPLAKSSLLSAIVAVELDERLVDACRNNCRLNHCLKNDETNKVMEETTNSNEILNESKETLVEIVKGDAAEWAAKTLRAQYREQKRVQQMELPLSSPARAIDSSQPISQQNTMPENRINQMPQPTTDRQCNKTKMNACNKISKPSSDFNNFDILLVDPPREGLDKTVCDMALRGTFRHMVYISCGRLALLRDLKILCLGGFEVVHMAVVDLFPGTDAVESLVHLRRR